mmetsp:Transcript_70527/g.131920  ORF Transcript_70527/g.131920 Transcript_70527/m.131920 type:complete len:470 (+) Transcript_70527:214-1623(+)
MWLPCIAVAVGALGKQRLTSRSKASFGLVDGRMKGARSCVAARKAIADISVQQGVEFHVGDDVEARLPDEGHWLPGVISGVLQEGMVQVRWHEPLAEDDEISTLSVDDVRKVDIFKDYQVGDKVECLYFDDGFFPAEVVAVNGDGTFKVKWDDAQGGPEESTCSYKDMEYPPTSDDGVEDLEVGQKYTATVVSIQRYGAFVKLHHEAEENALVPRACMVAGDREVDPRDLVEVGQQIEVWILKIHDDGKVAATMVQGAKAPPTFSEIMAKLNDIGTDEWIPARVFRTRPSFADIYVSIVDDFETRGSIHISQLADGYVDRVEDVVQEGQEVQVKFLRVAEKSQFDFTLLSSPAQPSRSSSPQRAPRSEWQSPSSSSDPPRRSSNRVDSFADLDDQWFVGTVSGVQPFGAFVDIEHPFSGDQVTGLVHVSQLSNDYVEDANDVVMVGQSVECWILQVDVQAGKVALSMRT